MDLTETGQVELSLAKQADDIYKPLSSPHHLPDPTNGITISWKFQQGQLLILMSSVNLSLVDVQTFPTLWLITHKCQTCKNDSSLDVFLLENYLQLSTSESSAKLGKT